MATILKELDILETLIAGGHIYYTGGGWGGADRYELYTADGGRVDGTIRKPTFDKLIDTKRVEYTQKNTWRITDVGCEALGITIKPEWAQMMRDIRAARYCADAYNSLAYKAQELAKEQHQHPAVIENMNTEKARLLKEKAGYEAVVKEQEAALLEEHIAAYAAVKKR